MKLYDTCLLYFTKQTMDIDVLPKTIQNDINVLRRLHQAKCTLQDKMDEYELIDCLHFHWWQDKLVSHPYLCQEYDGCIRCIKHIKIMQEKIKYEQTMEDMYKEKIVLEENLKKIIIPHYLYHVANKIPCLVVWNCNVCD